MNASSYARLAAVIFAIVAIVQLARAAAGWPITIGTVEVPVWASWVACVVAGVLAWLGFSGSRS
jgi:hypothetical protein